MAMSVGGGGEDAPMSDINTTPLVDVMLVLLVVIIIAIPIASHKLPVDLPAGRGTPDPLPPAVLAIVLGPLAERSMRQSLISSRGDVTTFVNPVEHPIALICILIAIALMLYPVFLNYRRKKESKGAGST